MSDIPDLQRARSLYHSGRAADARTLCETIVRRDPHQAEALHLLGILAIKEQDTDSAIHYLERAVAIHPEPVYFRNLALAYHARGALLQTETCLQKSCSIHPQDAENWQMLATLYQQQGKIHQATSAFKRLIELRPDHAEAMNTLGSLYHITRELEHAAHWYRRAIQAKPDFLIACNNLGSVLQQMDHVEEAAENYRRALQLSPGRRLWELRLAMLFPVVPDSISAVDKHRSQLQQALEKLQCQGFRTSPEELVQEGIYPPYTLMYHGRDDRPLREAWARMAEPSFPAVSAPASLTGQRRIGLLVTRGHEGIFVRSLGGILRHMDTTDFSFTIICASGQEAFLKEKLNCPQWPLLAIPDQIGQAARIIQEARFDILYYWEIATDALNYYLPFLRLAPIQCTSWGIQVTSGVPNVDYYLSSKLVEPPQAQTHYTERLLLADTLLSYQYRAKLPENPKQRPDFGLDNNWHLYLYPQQIGKFHPDFDSIAGEILRRDRKGRLVILRDRWPRSSERLRERLERALPDVANRILFLPRLDPDDYLSLIAASDVLLDPPHYGGVNSTYDGLSLGIPIVTSESDYHIGRYTAACYRKMGLEDCITTDTEDYIERAVKLGSNPSQREEFSSRILHAGTALFEDMDAVHEHRRLFDFMLEEYDKSRPHCSNSQ